MCLWCGRKRPDGFPAAFLVGGPKSRTDCAPAPRTLIGCALKTFDGTRRILDTIIFSLPATFEFSMLLLMTFFVYAAIGMALFYNVADLRSVGRRPIGLAILLFWLT